MPSVISHKSLLLIKFKYTMGTCFTNLRLFFHEFSFITKTPFPPLRKELNTVRVQLLSEASKLFSQAVFQHIVVRKTASSQGILQGAKNMEVRLYEIVTLGRIRENSPPQGCNCLLCAQICV